MENEDEYLSKVETKDGNFYLLLQKLSCDSEQFDLHITDGCGMWSKTVSEGLLQEMASKVEMDMEEYALQTTGALTCQHSANDCFVYQTVKNDATLEFSWKKVLDDGIKYQLGSISLPFKDQNKELIQTILNFSISKIQEYKDNAMSMKTEIERLSKDRDNAILRLEKCVVSKEEMELDLFQKFVAVLNDKKAKIRRLQEANEQQSKEIEQKDKDLSLDKDQGKKDLDANRNNDADDESQSQVKEHQDATVASNIGPCLFNDEQDTGPAIKRRRKRQTNKTGSTPSKPVLPEVKTQVKRTVSNANAGSTTSNESKQSSDVTRRSARKTKNSSTFPDDVEDLFADM